jgi:hypothetical protein
MRSHPLRLAFVTPAAFLVGGCNLLLGLDGDYGEAHDAAIDSPDSGPPEMPEVDAGPDAGSDMGVPDSGPSDFAMPPGKLVYHRYTDYFSGDSEMFVVDFPSGERGPEIGVTYELCNPLNGIFSPDGKQLAIGAMPRSEPCPPTDVNALEIYVLDLEHPGQKRQVTSNSVEDQDPQFSYSGDFLVFKHEGHVAEWPVGDMPFTTCDALAPGAFCYTGTMFEQSKPVITPDDATICFYEGHQDQSDIYCFDRAAAKTNGVDAVKAPAAVHGDVNDYRPTVDEKYLYYVRGFSSDDNVTYIARKSLSNLAMLGTMGPFCGDMQIRYDDPCTLGDDVLIYTEAPHDGGPRDLHVADFAGSFSRNLDDFSPGLNSGKDETGPDFWRAPP